MAGARAVVSRHHRTVGLCGTHADIHGDGCDRQRSVGCGCSGVVGVAVFVGVGRHLGVERFRPRSSTHHGTHVLAHPRVRRLSSQPRGHDARAWQRGHPGLGGRAARTAAWKEAFVAVYLIGLLGGSLGWVAFNADSFTPALGASGAAFGLLGAYLSGWPKDEIPFPLLLIRPWPVVLIALLYFGLELVRALATMDSGVSSGIAHMAHIGGFIAAYALLPLVARGGPVEMGVVDGGPSNADAHSAKRKRIKAVMIDLRTIDDPWTQRGYEVPKSLREPLKNLVQASDEPETRTAWMEHLADAGQCPVCEAPLGLVERRTGPHLQCSASTEHFEWPGALEQA